MKFLVFLLFLPYVLPFELPFGLFSSKSVQNTTTTPSSSTPRIAIIGAGAGGSSAAFWISKAKERFGLDVQVDVYETADYIGGRASELCPTRLQLLIGVQVRLSFTRTTTNHSQQLKSAPPSLYRRTRIYGELQTNLI
jgi:2-polyprenyl-6-methoxyphenol hydroxylase-like FAD-dependent oxidoreductase